jgi:Ca-activated chloride channel family protein
MDVRFFQLESLHWLWGVLALAALIVIAFHRRRLALARFATASLHARLLGAGGAGRRVVRAGLLLGTLVALVAGMIDPRWNVTWQQVHQRGIDIVVVLDLSRSMNAEDARPSRLDRAKQFIGELVEELRGDRVALITFAGHAAVRCPLTADYGAFRLALDVLDTDSAARGGSLLGDALRLAGEAFTDDLPDHKAIIVFSDGEDHGSYPLEAARKLREGREVPVYTVGIGDAETGARIPITVSGQRVHLTHQGQEVWSKMDAGTLREIALATGGAYLPVGTGTVDMARVYAERIEPAAKREFDVVRRKRHHPQYQWFAGLALALLLLESFMGSGRRKPAEGGSRWAG